MASPLEQDIQSLVPRVVAERRAIHRQPELGFEEHLTHARVKAWLEALGYTTRVMAETGLVADLDGGAGDGPTIALRADLDALPMTETTDLPYKSIHAGAAHKCGHDGHTAMLMGVAELLIKMQPKLRGRIRLVFQPAEEGVRGGGARVMVKEGVLEGVDEIYGLHNWPAYPKGELRVVAGPTMAQVYTFWINVKGHGGHGSQPQALRDPIVAASHMVVALQTVVSRGLGYEGGAVLSVGMFNAGEAENVIPSHAKISGTIRTFAPAVTERVLERLREVVAGTAAAMGVKTEVELLEGHPVLVNDPTCTAAVERAAAQVDGVSRVSADELPMAGGEDFAYFAEKVPAAYAFLGAGRPEGNTPGCHHPDFDFDDELIAVGLRYWTALVLDRLGTD